MDQGPGTTEHGPGIKSFQQNNLNTGTRLDVNSEVSRSYEKGFRDRGSGFVMKQKQKAFTLIELK